MSVNRNWTRLVFPALLLLMVMTLLLREPRQEWIQVSDDAPAPATKAAVVGAQP